MLIYASFLFLFLMSKKGSIIVGLVITAVVLVGGGFAADYFLKTNYGIGLFDIFNVIKESSNTLEEAPSIEDVKSSIGIEFYNNLTNQKTEMLDSMSLARDNIAQINNNTELVSVLNAAFGANYTMYLFSIQTIGNLSFKVFEWSIQLENGLITGFSEGDLFETPNVLVQVGQEAAYSIFMGTASTEQIIAWTKDNQLKINPLTEVTKVVNALPQVMVMVANQ